MTTRPNPAGASWLPSLRPAGRVAELGSLGGNSNIFGYIMRIMNMKQLAGNCVVNRACFLLLAWSVAGIVVIHSHAQEAVRFTSPTNGTVYLQPSNVPLTLQISIAVSNEFSAPTDIYDGTNFLGSTSLQQHDLLTWSNVAFGDHALVAIHRLSTGPLTSSVVRVLVGYGGWAIVPPGAAWHYRDGGVDLGMEWRGTNVDVSAWPQGPAKLGFGDDDVVTWVDWLNLANGEVYPTYYFRRTFIVPSPSALSNVAVRLRRDDGAIVYLNGVELFRDNMPAGAVNYRTYAASSVGNENEFIQRWLNPSRLRLGTNYLAVEIHNSGPQSHDIGFDLAVIADIPMPPPTLDVQRDGTNILVSWPTGYDGYALESAAGLPLDGSGWEHLTNQLASVQGRLMHTNPVAMTRFFRLSLE